MSVLGLHEENVAHNPPTWTTVLSVSHQPDRKDETEVQMVVWEPTRVQFGQPDRLGAIAEPYHERDVWAMYSAVCADAITTWWSQTAMRGGVQELQRVGGRRTSKRKQVNNRRPLVDETMLDKFGPLVRGGDCEIVAQQMHRCLSQQYIRCMGQYVVVEGGGEASRQCTTA